MKPKDDDPPFSPKSAPFRLDLKVISAKNLVSKDSNGLSDPYCKISIANDHFKQFFKTKVVTKSLNPVWNHSFVLYPQFEHTCLLITVWDRDVLSRDDFLGCCRFFLHEAINGERKKVEIKLNKLKIYPIIEEEVDGSILIEVQLTKLINEECIAYWDFQERFNSNHRFKRAILKDMSLNGHHHGTFKNLETDNVIQTKGMKRGELAGSFSGFNYISASNPLKGIPQWSICIWFRVEDPSSDHILLSAMTSHPKDIQLKKNVNRPPIALKEYGKTESSSKLPAVDVEATKLFKSGFLICTHEENEFRDNFGRNLIVNEDDDDFKNRTMPIFKGKKKRDDKNDFDYALDDSVFIPDHVKNRVRRKSSASEIFIEKKKNRRSKKGEKNQQKERFVPNFFLNENPNPNGSSNETNKDDDEDEDDDFQRHEFFKDDDWNHLVVTYNGRYLKEYINGVLVDTKNSSYQFIGCVSEIQIGGWDNDMCLRGMKGFINDIRIMNYPLRKEQVEVLYNNEKPDDDEEE